MHFACTRHRSDGFPYCVEGEKAGSKEPRVKSELEPHSQIPREREEPQTRM